MKVLLADDDMTLAEVTAFALQRAGFLVVTATDGAQALELWANEQPDLVLLDVQMPHKDGLTTCRELRAMSDVPIIMLTVLASDEDVVRGLDTGADDYITKPFSPRQLVARMQAVLRRRTATPNQPLQCGPFRLDPTQYLVQAPRGAVRLTRLEYRLLHYLVVNQGQVLPTDSIVTHVWGYADGDRGLLKQLVFRLRQKLAQAADHDAQVIETIPGIGYTIPRARAVGE
ncbi:MAG: response regulator transcription factor [Chloroflexaceae bacterium]|jgi:DNA-binding response OmpR family regulator|nr:response regulator transcription factor [Chloroflexaceae bacterium]